MGTMTTPFPPRRFSFHSLVRRSVAVAAAMSIAVTSALPAFAQSRGGGVPIVRDAEIEALVADYAAPILKAAGLGGRGVRVILVNSQSFNAFVDGRRIFINTGAIMQAETPNEIIGVIAHESGHLAGGHQERLREQLSRARNMAIIGMLLGVGAGVAGAASGSGNAAGAGAGIAMGSSEVAMRSVLNYQRTEEMTADRLAVNYLNATGQSTKGMLDTFERFASALSLTGTQIDQYRISHPLPRERIANLEELARKSPYFNKADSPALQMRHDMARAKIAAYSGNMGALQRMFRSNPGGLPARYGNAITTFLNGSARAALPKFDALIKEQPKNPYFQEMRGEVLLKANDAAGAAKAFQKAVSLDPRKSPLLRMSYGRALMLTGAKANMPTAIKEIKAGIASDPEFPGGYGYLAQAYGQQGDMALADLATADMNYYSGKLQQAQIFAIRAQKQMKPRSPEWLRAQDIINAKKSK
ncbi:M48 family metallopeptidase [Brucella tritici]|uniref:M48 family metallopeptidase n=1 Tax=Brucella tritici TaxID=94626 RepID=A0A6N6QA24_9HYPH|nr:M48 family metalloprotease [Brucella tritici]KAB2665882.1 M48 family metallopeptidase [Brucella tritici]KAB2673321.1 M48 family metallopeptidase [Brucella tritici]KAB2688879.1 M48 family metallopeptidase [Brucella tritici]